MRPTAIIIVSFLQPYVQVIYSCIALHVLNLMWTSDFLVYTNHALGGGGGGGGGGGRGEGGLAYLHVY